MAELLPFLRFLVRDMVFLALLAAAWITDATMERDAGALALVVGVITGGMTTLAGFLCHEWGHLLGALASGGVVHAPRSSWSPFLFFFDVSKSSRRAFLVMSVGGYAASALALGLIVALVPWDKLSGRVALSTAALGVLITFALEVPTTLRVARGAALPRGGVYADEAGHPKGRGKPPSSG